MAERGTLVIGIGKPFDLLAAAREGRALYRTEVAERARMRTTMAGPARKIAAVWAM